MKLEVFMWQLDHKLVLWTQRVFLEKYLSNGSRAFLSKLGKRQNKEKISVHLLQKKSEACCRKFQVTIVKGFDFPKLNCK